jgi:hypothetical protein
LVATAAEDRLRSGANLHTFVCGSQRLPNDRDSVAIRLQDSHRHTVRFTKGSAAQWRAERESFAKTRMIASMVTLLMIAITEVNHAVVLLGVNSMRTARLIDSR